METESLSIASILPQLSIGVVAVIAFAISIYFFIRHLERCNNAAREEREEYAAAAERRHEANAKERAEHLGKIEEHHQAMRSFESEIRTTVMSSLNTASAQMKENTHLMTRIIDYLDQPQLHPSFTAVPRRRPRKRPVTTT